MRFLVHSPIYNPSFCESFRSRLEAEFFRAALILNGHPDAYIEIIPF